MSSFKWKSLVLRNEKFSLSQGSKKSFFGLVRSTNITHRIFAPLGEPDYKAQCQ